MIQMEIESIKIEDLRPYENNPRRNDGAVEGVKESIRQFGFKIPIVIDKNNVIICGHTRFKASQELGLKEIPFIRADDLSDDQIKAFRIVDNKVAEVAEWDNEKLRLEMEDIDLDLSVFGLDLEGFDEIDLSDDSWYGDERERTNKAYNLDLIDWDNLSNDFWQMPIIENDNFVPTDLIGFNYALNSNNKDCGIHFYVDDYQFERVWNDPAKYVDALMEYECILSPDFSLYMDMPIPMKIWNIYRSRFIGHYYQTQGIKVIPTISWAEPETFEFCFRGIPRGSIVSVSTIGVKNDEKALKIWTDGMTEMIKQIRPKTILVYGGKIDFDYGKTKVVYYENHVTENWKRVES